MTGDPHCTDLGNGRRLARRHGERFRFDRDRNAFLVYDGRRWREDNIEMDRLAKETSISIYDEAASAADSALKKQLAHHAARSESARAIRAMIEMAKSESGIAVRAADLDPDPYLFNVGNGTVDLRTGRLRPHVPGDLITKLAPVTFDHDATCPAFLAFLERIFDGDRELVGFLQRFLGYSLTGVTDEQVLAMLYGVGANGKSTLLELIFRLLGDYGVRAEVGMFLTKRSEGPRNDLAAAVGARFLVASEAGEERRWDEAFIKEVTGGETVTCRRLYADLFSYRPTFKVWIATNAKPEVRSTGEAIWRRLLLIPFDVVIPEEERDPHLLEKLTAELPGVLRWALEGCLAWQRDGLGRPPAVRQATAAYRDESDLVSPFIEEECRVGANERVAASWLYKAFKEWAERCGESVISQQAFGRRLSEKGFQRVRARGGRHTWAGLSLAVTDGTDWYPDSRKVPHEEMYEEVSGKAGTEGYQGSPAAAAEAP